MKIPRRSVQLAARSFISRSFLADIIICQENEKTEIIGLSEEIWQKVKWPTLPIPIDLVSENINFHPVNLASVGSKDCSLTGYAALILSLDMSAEWRWYLRQDSAENARRQSIENRAKILEIQKFKPLAINAVDELRQRVEALCLTVSLEEVYIKVAKERFEYNPRGLRNLTLFVENAEAEKLKRDLRNTQQQKRRSR
jgi:hypothetical protein